MNQYQISRQYIQEQLRKADERRVATEAKDSKQEKWVSKRSRRNR